MADETELAPALVRLEAVIGRLEEALKRGEGALTRLKRVESLVEAIARAMEISPHD